MIGSTFSNAPYCSVLELRIRIQIDVPLAANSERGLLWVISKINSARSKSGKIKRFIKHDEPVLILRERAQIDVTTFRLN